MTRAIGRLLLLSVMAFACGDDDDSGGCVYDSQCDLGEICRESKCVPAAGTGGSGGFVPADGGTAGAGGTTGTGAAGGTTGTGGAGGSAGRVCGNGSCEFGENCSSCPDDCICTCGDGVCSESDCEHCANCPEDCGECRQATCTCGDGVCDSYYCDEHCDSCPDDCALCGEDAGTEPTGDAQGARPGEYYCGNGVCEPGEDDSCADCSSVEATCDQDCSSNCDCAQPWTACGIGKRTACMPVACRACFDQSLSCCWCPKEDCAAVTCKNPTEACPGC